MKSDEERFCLWYLEEIKEAGYINQINPQPSPILLAQAVDIFDEVATKSGKIKEIRKNLLREHVYTPDFEIIWTPKAKGIFIGDSKVDYTFKKSLFYSDGLYSCIEVKPVFDHQGMQRLFSINQKWVHSATGIYVQKVIPQPLFGTSFTPKKLVESPDMIYKVGSKKGKSKINWTIKTLQEYVKGRT